MIVFGRLRQACRPYEPGILKVAFNNFQKAAKGMGIKHQDMCDLSAVD